MATPVSEVSRRRRRRRIAVSLNKEGSFYPSFFPEHLLRNAFYWKQTMEIFLRSEMTLEPTDLHAI